MNENDNYDFLNGYNSDNQSKEQEPVYTASVHEHAKYDTLNSSRQTAYENAMYTRKEKSKNSLGVLAFMMSCVVLVLSLASIACNWYLYNMFKDQIASHQSQGIGGGNEDPGGIAQIGNNKNIYTAATIYKKLSPTVASITVTTADGGGSGSGVVISADGYIVTNEHVINSATKISVKLGENVYEATLVGKDQRTDLAVIKIEATDLPFAKFAQTSTVSVGDEVCAIGNPYSAQLELTITKGIISGIRENIIINGKAMDLLQTDTAINPGNSGGPLINMYGLVIGINSSKILSSSGISTEGLGFAIPTAVALPVIDEIIENGYVKNRPMIGIKGTEYVNDDECYIEVVFVSPNSDAYVKGLKSGDRIIMVDKKAFSSFAEFEAIKNTKKIGDTMLLTILRDGKQMDIEISIIENEPDED